MSKLTFPEYLEKMYNDPEGDGIFSFNCASCDCVIDMADASLVSPCHPETGFLEGSGHGGLEGMHIYCQMNDPEEVCEWGGPVTEFESQVLCIKCRKNPFLNTVETI